jgi:penicillin amidase
VHARERLFQMDLMRRAARGELAEVAGPAALPLDRVARTLGVRQAAEDDLAAYPADTRAMLDAYAAGVNGWIAEHGRFAALEFVALGAPRPWTAGDSVLWGKTMGLYLSANWRTELARLSLSGRLTRQQIDALWPSETASATEARIAPGLADMATRLAGLVPAFPAPFTLPQSASNAWAVDGAHSATGAPILAGDPHLSFGLPGIWYLARIETPSGVLVGATAPGVPFLVIGHNGRIAWSFTTTGADVQDLFIETPSGDGYLTEAGPRPFVSRDELIHVRDGPDETLHVRTTRHGAVISDLTDSRINAAGGQVVSLAMANLAPGDLAPSGLLALNRARSVAEAGAAAPRITAPVQNMMVADRDGIGFFVTGRVPVRRSGDGAYPARGDDGSGDWIGWAAGDALPHHVAPSSGRLVNANERVAPPDFPVPLGRDWFGDARARRIRAMLDAAPKPVLADMARMQTDDLDVVAADLLPALRRVAPRFDVWDGRMDRDRAEPLIFQAWMDEFTRMLLARHQIPDSAAGAVAPWPDLVRHALSPDGSAFCEDCQRLLAESYSNAMSRLGARFGADPATWRWGAAHQAVFAHPILRFVPVLGRLIEGRIEQNGGDSTVGRGGVRSVTMESVHGASFRGVYDLADLERSRFMLAPGQSGHPVSAFAQNFVRGWRDGDTMTFAASPSGITSRMRLTP